MYIYANGIRVEYDMHGPDSAPAVVLINGAGQQLTRWSMTLVDHLVTKGFRVIRPDNRDCGLSSKFDDAGVPEISGILASLANGVTPAIPYRMSDMADDVAALLGALGIDRAHLVGASMGGVIAQAIAANHPDRTLSLTSIMSTTGNPALPQPTDDVAAALFAPPAQDPEAIIDQMARFQQLIGSPAYPIAIETLRERAREDVQRSYSPTGLARQFAALLSHGDRRPQLKAIDVPTLVIHGIDDPLIPVEAGRDTAATIPGATLLEIPGMGHNLPEPVLSDVAETIIALAARARR